MKAAIYCRLSEEDRDKLHKTDDSGSIQNQKTMLIQYAMDHEWEVFDIYSDDDYAGADRNRPEFNRLLDDAKAHKFDIVLCKTQSRFTRELEMVEKYIHGLFPKWGIRFVSIVDNADTANKGNKKSRQINGLVNEWYLEDMSENIKSVLTSRRENGFHIGAFALYGYKKDPQQKGHLIIDEPAAAIVREVFTLYANGTGKTAIARLLNARGIPNPTEYKRQQGLRYQQPKRKEATLWKYFAIGNMLGNEIYIGNLIQGRYGSIDYKTKENRPRPKELWIRADNTHEPIIDQELWDRVQLMRMQRARPFANGELGVFAKKARCMYCGYYLRSSKTHGKRYLKCETNHVASDACIGAFVPEEELNGIVLKELKRLIAEYADAETVGKRVVLTADFEEQLERKKKELSTCEKQHNGYTHALSEAYLDKVGGKIGDEIFNDLTLGLNNDKERIEENMKKINEDIEMLTLKLSSQASVEEIVAQYLDVQVLDRPLTDKLIDFIEVGRRDPTTHEVPVIIHWNF